MWIGHAKRSIGGSRMTPCPQSEKDLPCLWAPHQSGQRVYLACLMCGRPKPAEPCYFVEQGEKDREAISGAN